QLLLQHELLGRERGARRARREDLRLRLRERRQVERAPAHGVEQRVVRLVELALRGGELLAVEERHGREAARRVDLALALVRAADLLVARRARDAEDGVERRLLGGDGGRRRALTGLRGGEGQDAPRDALHVARALAGRAVDEQRFVAPDGDPH